MKRKSRLMICLCLALSIICVAQSGKSKKAAGLPMSEAEDCNLTFAGSARKSVKLRTAQDGSGYRKLNNGQPMTVTEWLQTACSTFDLAVRGKAIKDQPISGVETQEVTLEGYLMGARFENDGDLDIHAEIADKPGWSATNYHVIVEVPPGQAYCSARKSLWDLAKNEVPAGKNSAILSNGPKIRVTGYVFVDTAHGGSHFCTNNGGRGIKDSSGNSNVKGLWEVHPVLQVQTVP
jgi:hypothetical protein